MSFTYKDAGGVTRYADAGGSGSSGDPDKPRIQLIDSSGNPVAADDAAAAGPIFPAAGVYQATVDEVDDGDVGRLRMTSRRVLVQGADAVYETGTNTFSASSSAQAPSFTWPRWARECSIHIANGTNQAMSIQLSVRDQDSLISANSILGNFYVGSSDIGAGGVKTYAHQASGSGASNYIQVPSLRGNYYGLRLRIGLTPAGVATGDVKHLVIWSS